MEMMRVESFIQQGKTEEAFKVMKQEGILFDELLEYSLVNSLGNAFLHVLVRMVVEHDPAQCDQLHRFLHTGQVYEITLARLLLATQPLPFDLFEAVVSRTSAILLCTRDERNSTLLNRVIVGGFDVRYVRVLLRHGADPAARNANSLLPIDCIHWGPDERVADVLLEYGSDKGVCRVGKRMHHLRRQYKRMCFVLGVCLLKRTWVPKDVIRSCILPHLWESRFE